MSERASRSRPRKASEPQDRRGPPAGRKPAAHKPGGKPAAHKPGGKPAAHKPGGKPAAHKPGGKPAAGTPERKPAAHKPGGKPAAHKPGGKPAAHKPGGKPAARTPERKPAARTPERKPAARTPERKPAAQARPEKNVEAVVLDAGPKRSGTVALIGRANVGKSTLLNAALGHPLAIVSPTPQTTRDTLLGVLHRGNAELRLLDTPGLHKPKTELGRVMNHHAREAARAADVVVFVTDVSSRGRPAGAPIAPHLGDLTLLQSLKEPVAEAAGHRPVVLVINKVDQIRDKSVLLPLIEAFSKVLPFDAVLPISARREQDIARVTDVIAGLLPEGAWQFGPDDMTDRPTRYFAAEYVREQILRATRLEVPHAAAVTIDRFNEPERGAVEIDVTIHVERPGQKKIMVGKGGATLKLIGTEARLRVEELLGRKVILKTWVRVTEAWRASAERLAEMGYQKRPQDEGVLVFAELPDEDDAEPGEDAGVVHVQDEDEEQEQ